jgi:hypothetical protein
MSSHRSNSGNLALSIQKVLAHSHLLVFDQNLHLMAILRVSHLDKHLLARNQGFQGIHILPECVAPPAHLNPTHLPNGVYRVVSFGICHCQVSS